MGILNSIIREGGWWLRSISDPRWNCNGRSIVGGLTMPAECERRIKKLKLKFGDPPDDLEWGYMKD